MSPQAPKPRPARAVGPAADSGSASAPAPPGAPVPGRTAQDSSAASASAGEPIPARVAANRANAKKSTGPRLLKGHLATNPLKHGLRARALLLPGEDPAALEALRASIWGQLSPVGSTEEILAEHVVACAWRLLRLGRFEARTLQHLEAEGLLAQPQICDSRVLRVALRISEGLIVDPEPSRFLSLETLRRYEKQIERGFYGALGELRRLKAERAAVPPDHEA